MAEDRTGQIVAISVSQRGGVDAEGYAVAAAQPGYRGIDHVSAGGLGVTRSHGWTRA